MGYLSTNGSNEHQLPRFCDPRVNLIKVEKTGEGPVEKWSMAFFAFTFSFGFPVRQEIISIPYDYTDGEWLFGAASCGTTFPLELRSDALAIIGQSDPFSCT